MYDLRLAGESEPIGVTARHPFWSVDRGAWVSAIDLEIGETLETLTGTTVVESMKKRPEPETVYNIEVEGDHVYRVGESGVLVHNASAPCCSGFTHGGTETEVEIVKVGSREVPIYGKGQQTGDDKCPGGVNKHRQASVKTARKEAQTGRYDYLTLNRQWNTATAGISTHTNRPDVIGVRCDGKVDAWEIISERDTRDNLQARVDAGRATLPKANRGNTFVIDTSC